ncbi:MAG: hypothetical protein U0232_04680 [Thermomicrobiales bacterium]
MLIREIWKLRIPGVLIGGRFDERSAGDGVAAGKKGWASGELHVLGDAGHGGVDMSSPLVVGALNRFGGCRR